MFKERLADGLPAEARTDTALVDALARPNDADLDEFRRGIDPLASSGRLGALLAQFPASFKGDTASRDYSRRCCARLPAIRWPSSCAIEAGATASPTRSRC